jgi:hypothetical protein
MSRISAPSTPEKNKAILSKARRAIEMSRAAATLQYDCHLNRDSHLVGSARIESVADS